MASTALQSPLVPLADPPTTTSPPSPPSAPPAPLTAAQIAIVKSTAPVLREHGATITTTFYHTLLTAHPSLRNMFNLNAQASGAQPQALARAVLAYAAHVDDLPALRAAVERIAHKHASLGVQPAQYALVGEHLLAAIGAVLGAAATPAIVDAWTAAYAALAEVFVRREEELYAAQGAWRGVWRRFVVVRREVEAEGVVSLYLAPGEEAAGAPLPPYMPGQYVSVRVDLPHLGLQQSRQYSLSAAPGVGGGEHYRISVRREEHPMQGGSVTGSISNLLFDKYAVGGEVHLTHPQGEYFVDPADGAKEGVPLVLVSAGVGATPNLAILESLVAEGAVKRPVSWVHASRSKAAHPFAEAVRTLKRGKEDSFSSHVFLRYVKEGDEAGKDFDSEGRMDLSKLDKQKDLFIDNVATEYFICGPESFMVDMAAALEGMGVSRERIRMELFATGDVA